MRTLTSLLLVLLASGMFTYGFAEDKTKQGKENPVVVLETSLGDITIELWAEKAPITTNNFLRYVEDNFFDNTIFHRVIDNFMIQGGGFTPDMKQKTTHEPIKNEASKELENKRGTIAMARTSDVNSATSQFFINVVDNDFLDHKNATSQGFGYAVFGQVVDGMDVVDKIKDVKTTRFGHFQDVPAEPVVIKRAYKAEKDE